MSAGTPKYVCLTKRGALLNGVRQALTDLKVKGDKSFVESVEETTAALVNVKYAVVVLDWDIGIPHILDFFDKTRDLPERENWQILLVAAEQSEKIIAAGAEFGVAKVNTGNISPTKIKLILQQLGKEAAEVKPLQAVMSKISNARNNGEWEAATSLLENLHKKDPENRRIIHELSENYLQEGKWKKCYELLVSMKDMEPPDVRILHSLGKALIKLGKAKSAAEVMKKAKLINPYNVQRLIGLGNVLLQLDANDEAEENFVEARNLAPGNKDAIKGHSTCKLLDGDVNEALNIMKNAVSGRELASVFNTAAVLSMRLGRFPKGMSLYDAAEKVLAEQTEILARVLFNKGIGFYRWKKFSSAKSCFERAVDLDPEFEDAKHNLKAVSGDSTSVPAAAPARAPKAPPAETPSFESVEQYALDADVSLDFDFSLEGDGESGLFGDDLDDEDERI